jgi:hypothetical protein
MRRFGREGYTGCPDLESLDRYFEPYMSEFGWRFGCSVYAYDLKPEDFIYEPGDIEYTGRLRNARLV